MIVPRFVIGLTDASLVALNVFNAFMIFSHIHPVESPAKKPAVTAGHTIVYRVHSAPFLRTSVIVALVASSLWFMQDYRFSQDSSSLLRGVISAYTVVCTSILMKYGEYLIKLGVRRVLEIERDVSTENIQRFKPPSKAVMDTLVAPARLFFNVHSVGLDRITRDAPHLFVSNHSLYGLEMPIFLNHIYQNTGILPRGLADHFHFALPNGAVLRAFGAVDGTRENVDTLMQSGQSVLVYPGGGHEVLKKSSVPRYELMWKDRLGFARMAIKHGYPILPCACVGIEDMFIPLGDIPTPYRGYVIPLAYTTPARCQRMYFWFGSPISTSQYNGDFDNDDFARKVRDETKNAIENGIKELRQFQENDPKRYLVNQMCSMLKKSVFGDSNEAADEVGEGNKLKTS
ncbi:hypothetical protein ACHAW6_003228 [Cyclotella cf. meneghiniana]